MSDEDFIVIRKRKNGGDMKRLSECVFLVDDILASVKFYTEIFGVSGAEHSPGKYSFDLSEGHRLWLSDTLIPGIELRAGLRFIDAQGEEIYSRAKRFGFPILSSGVAGVFRCLDPDGFVLTFIVPDEPGHYIYFASEDFLPEKSEPFIKVPGGYYFIGRGKLPGCTEYATRAEAEIALENRRAMSTSFRPLELLP